jgi:hypothetical protein
MFIDAANDALLKALLGCCDLNRGTGDTTGDGGPLSYVHIPRSNAQTE